MPTTEYLWDDETDTVVMELDETGATKAVYNSDPVPYGRLFSMRRDGTTYDYRYDAQGNTRALTDETGKVTDTYRYDAWGVPTAHTGTTENPYRFGGRVGYQYDEATGDYYVRERTYEPERGRWKSIDPLRDVTQIPYGYAANRSTTLIDPSGRATEELKTVACPFTDEVCGCVGEDCLFRIGAAFRAGFAELCFRQGPGEESENRSTQTCTPAIDRTLRRTDHFTITLKDGTKCKFTEKVMPPDRPFPPKWDLLPETCNGIIILDETRGCYRTRQAVARITVKFSIRVSCGCSIVVDGVRHNIVEKDTIELDGSLPRSE